MAQGPMGPFCQSCGMPLARPDDFGTTGEGIRQNDYCRHCFQDGRFIQPDITLAEMIEQVIPYTLEATGMTTAEVRALIERTLPELRRWH